MQDEIKDKPVPGMWESTLRARCPALDFRGLCGFLLFFNFLRGFNQAFSEKRRWEEFSGGERLFCASWEEERALRGALRPAAPGLTSIGPYGPEFWKDPNVESREEQKNPWVGFIPPCPDQLMRTQGDESTG